MQRRMFFSSIRMMAFAGSFMCSFGIKGISAVLASLCFLILAPLCFAASSDGANLKSLYDSRQWLELRDFVAKGGAPKFYQGAVACVFNDLQQCEKKLKTVINASPRSDDAFRSHDLLANAYLRQGKYRKALAQVDAMLALQARCCGCQKRSPAAHIAWRISRPKARAQSLRHRRHSREWVADFDEWGAGDQLVRY